MRALSWGVGLWMMLSAASGSAAEPTASPQPTASQKSTVTVDLAAEANRLLRETAVALQSRSIEPSEEAAFVGLLNVAEALKTADKPAPSDRERLRALARVRLRQAAEVLAKQKPRSASDSKLDAKLKRPATVAEPADTTLAQQGPAQAAAGLGFLAGSSSTTTASGNAADVEGAQNLMDVITRSIQPETWEEAGGKGVIRYWAVGHALVITATSDVHNGVGDLIGQLRRAP
ncbi:MAG: hypothetical protein JNK76_00200 [Planctomycetales bacterium]|nr:hypothetical protein [Planctomycetales bacterium]MBN8624564.1 hypothetical protein [Planctomycetota bacterium]